MRGCIRVADRLPRKEAVRVGDRGWSFRENTVDDYDKVVKALNS
jgi:hypothetical protein